MRSAPSRPEPPELGFSLLLSSGLFGFYGRFTRRLRRGNHRRRLDQLYFDIRIHTQRFDAAGRAQYNLAFGNPDNPRVTVPAALNHAFTADDRRALRRRNHYALQLRPA